MLPSQLDVRNEPAGGDIVTVDIVPVYSADPDLSAGFVYLCRRYAGIFARSASDTADVPQVFSGGAVKQLEGGRFAVFAVYAYVLVRDSQQSVGNQSLRPAFQGYELRLTDPLRYEDVLSLFQVGIVD